MRGDIDTTATSQAGPSRAERVPRALAASESLGTAAAFGKLLLGIVLCLPLPLVVAVVAKSVEVRQRAHLLPGFWGTFALASCVVVPLLLGLHWLDRRKDGDYFSDAVDGTAPDAPSSYGEYRLQSGRLAAAAYADVIMLGPRMLWAFFEWLAGRQSGDAALRTAAAQVAVELLEAGEGLPVKRLIRLGRPAQEVTRCLRYLVAREWVGVSSDGRRAWLLTPARERLATRLGIRVMR